MNPCCCHLKTGVLIVGILEVVFHGIYCAVSALAIILLEFKRQLKEKETSRSPSSKENAGGNNTEIWPFTDLPTLHDLDIYWTTVISIGIYGLGLIFGIVLLVGIKQGSRTILRSWLFLKLLLIGLNGGLVIVVILKGKLRVSTLIPNVIFVLFGIYFLLVIFKYQKQVSCVTRPMASVPKVRLEKRNSKKRQIPGPIVQTPSPTHSQMSQLSVLP